MLKFIKYLIEDWNAFPKGQIVLMAVWDAFEGKVKILKNRRWRWYIEIVDVYMCYPQQVPLRPGERMWITQKEIYREIPNPNRKGNPLC